MRRLIRYSLLGEYYAKSGESRHPQVVIREKFPGAYNLIPQSIADCWIFNVDLAEPFISNGVFDDIGEEEATP